ncbi:MAG TPA: GNAT family N-acetyltransferase [Steroidobacteraceae bacterium]|nr:GNAT family N-acetyltransferase [Steroidobacteraceae bacterium]
MRGRRRVHRLPAAAEPRACAQLLAEPRRRGRARRVLVAEADGGHLLGTLQLALEQPENKPHRADIAKMLVRRAARRRGVGAALLAAAERQAADAGRTLLVLDTATEEAARLYARHGWQLCGTIPNYALLPDGTPCATRVYYKALTP